MHAYFVLRANGEAYPILPNNETTALDASACAGRKNDRYVVCNTSPGGAGGENGGADQKTIDAL